MERCGYRLDGEPATAVARTGPRLNRPGPEPPQMVTQRIGTKEKCVNHMTETTMSIANFVD